MELQEAMELFEEIVELCYETENPRIIEVIEEIYSEVEYSTSVPKVISALEELQVVINQQDLTEDEEEITNEIQEKIELMCE